MIEVEKNFDLKAGDKERLIEGAEFVRNKTFTDVYYDNDAYSLTSKDFWVRKRNNNFELKASLNAKGANREITDQYRELETEPEIAAELGLAITTNLETALAQAGYKPFATITTKRESYRKGDFNLDFDQIPEMNYTTFEVELMVTHEKDVPSAETRVMEFAQQHNITVPGRGKVIEYLLLHNPAHYQVLKAKGVLRD